MTLQPNCDRCEDCEELVCELPTKKYHDDCDTCGCQTIAVDDFGHVKCQKCWDELNPDTRLRINQAAWDERFNMGDPECDHVERPGGY